MNQSKNVIVGLILVCIGVLLGLNALQIISFNLFFEGWWTFIIIIPCLIDLLTSHDKTGPAIGLLIGITLFLSIRGYIDFSLIRRLIIPVILILIGISIVFNNTWKNKTKKKIDELNQNNNSQQYVATFSSQTLDFTNESFKGIDLIADFGGIDCYLYHAILEDDVIINVSTTFGGVDIYVPDNVNIKIKSQSLFGGVSCKKKNKTDNQKTIYINAKCLFGGVEIK